MTTLRRRTTPAPVLRLAAAALASSVAVAACEGSPALHARSTTTRLGAAAGYFRAGGVSRPVLDHQKAAVSMEVPPAGEAVLELAATTLPTADGSAAPPRACRASFRAGDAVPASTLELALDGQGRWTEGRLPLPAAPRGGTLELSCDAAEGVAWARPILVPQAASPAAPLVVLLSLDTLRADHVTGFGDPAVPTPALAAVAKEGISFTAAASPYTWTLPAHFSLFYSRLYGFPPAVSPAVGLAERLAAAGFASAGFTGGGFVGSEFLFHRGFDRYAEYNTSGKDFADIERFPALLDDAGRWIDEHRASPSFVFLHTYAVHELPPSERAKSHGTYFPMTVTPTPDEVAVAHDYYARLVGRVDAALAPFFDRLRRIARDRPTLLVVLSDHGEAFWEHRNFRHGAAGANITLHDEVIRVPMVFWAPGIVAPGRESAYPFSLLDVAPTLLAAAGLPTTPGMTGRDFWPLVSESWTRHLARYLERWDAPVVSYKGADLSTPEAWSSRSDTRKRIVNRPRGPGAGDVETYDLARDPHENHDLADADPEQAAAFAIADVKRLLRQEGIAGAARGEALPSCPSCDWASIDAYLGSVLGHAGTDDEEKSDGPNLDPETRRRLQALGYLN